MLDATGHADRVEPGPLLDPPLSLLLLHFDPIDADLLAPLMQSKSFHVIRAGALDREWVAYAQRANAVVVASEVEPLAALVYVLSAGIDTPVVVSALAGGHVEDQELIAAGAFHCLALPVSAQALSGLHSALRRVPAQHRVDAQTRLVLDPIARVVRVGSRKALLSQREYAILDLLSRRSGMPVSAESLLAYAWGGSGGSAPSKRLLDVHVCHVRRKLDGLGLPIGTRTLRGYGYVLGFASRGDRRSFHLST